MVTQAEFESATFGFGGWSETQLRGSARSKVTQSVTKCPEVTRIVTVIVTARPIPRLAHLTPEARSVTRLTGLAADQDALRCIALLSGRYSSGLGRRGLMPRGQIERRSVPVSVKTRSK